MILREKNLRNGVTSLNSQDRKKKELMNAFELAIARALYNKPDLLILDEATNSIDLSNEKNIFDNILKNFSNISIIFVNHRETNFLVNGKIFIIEDGKINEK